jgi:hypothetical protein
MEILQITIELQLPFYSWTFIHDYEDNFSGIPFRKAMFNLKVVQSDEEKNFTICQIEWTQQSESRTISEGLKSRAIEKGIDFVNYIIYHARTFDIETHNLVLVSPRTVKTVNLKINKENASLVNEQMVLKSDPPEYFREFFEYLNEPGAFDAFSEIVKEEEIALLEINLLVDAYHAIYESRYSEAVINCLTAIETHIYPILKVWLTDKFQNKSEKNAENVLMDMSSATKFELLFGSVSSEFLGGRTKLLEDLKGINKLRNEIIHKAKRATKSEAIDCLNTSSNFIMILFFKIEPDKSE